VIVRLRVGLSGAAGAWAAGELYETDEGTAGRLVAAGCADYVVEDVPTPAPETTMRTGGPERAVQPRGRKRG
jgi:hypothetical protein